LTKGLGSKFAPSFYIMNRGEDSVKVALSLTRAAANFVIRFTGGCGYMSAEDARGLYDLFVDALEGFKGCILFGGTRMVKKVDYDEIVPGITEVPPLIKAEDDSVVILGIVPRTGNIRIDPSFGVVVESEYEHDFITIIHPEQDMCLVVQQSVDKEATWEDEYLECIQITENLRSFAGWSSLLISYNGGAVTEKEILHTAELGWPVLLVNGSGRMSEKYANDNAFLLAHPNVLVAEKTVGSIRNQLVKAGAISERAAGLRLVSNVR
jgi:hypothetical protein